MWKLLGFKIIFWGDVIYKWKNSKCILSFIFILRLARPDAKRFVLQSLIWDLMTSALLEVYQEILNYPIMTAMENPLKSTMDLENLRQRTPRSLPLPSLWFPQQQSESTSMPEPCSRSASCSSMLYIGLYIYDKSICMR